MKQLLLLFLLLSSAAYSQQGWDARTVGSGNLVSLNFINGKNGYIFQTPNILHKTLNGGDNWVVFILPITVNGEVNCGMFKDSLNGIYLTRSSTGVPWNHQVYITNNSGLNWNQGRPNVEGNLILDKCFLADSYTAFVCGTDVDLVNSPVTAVISKTTNAGANWINSYRGEFELHDIVFIDHLTGYSVFSAIHKTINGGLNWAYISLTNRAMYDFSKFFDDTVYIAADSGYVIKSIDGGYNLTYHKAATNQKFNDIYFINSLTGYVVGDSGKIFRTSNGGLNWINQNSGTSKRLNEIWFINKDTGYIAADSGLLLYTYNGGLTSLISNNEIIPVDFELYQNYPNPFNPETKIKFSLPKTKHAKLEIFDLSGKLMSTIVNEILIPGNYEYSFNTNGFAGGVYFYMLTAGEYRSIKKMVLLK